MAEFMGTVRSAYLNCEKGSLREVRDKGAMVEGLSE